MKSELSLRIVPELSDLTKAIDKITKNTSEGLSKAIDTPLNKLKDRLKMELNIGTKIAGPKLPESSLKEMGKQIREATNVKLDLDLKEANAKIDSMRYQVLGAFAGFKGLVEKPIKVAMEFETAMSDVKKVVDFESASELKAFEKEIWKLTRTIPLSAKDLTNIVASGGELGLDKNILIPFTDVVAKMSTAFNISTEQAGDSIAGLMKKMGLNIDEVKELGDIINTIGASSAGTPSEVVEILGRIGGLTKTLGISAQHTAGIAGAFANMKIPAEQSATAINKMLNVLGGVEATTPKTQEALKKLGFDTQEFKQAMINNPLEALVSVLKGIEGASEGEKIGLLKTIFGEEAGPKIAQITANMEEFDRILGIVGDKKKYTGSMQREFDEVSKTTANSFQLMENAFDNVAKVIGDVFLPVLGTIASGVANVAGKLADWLETMPRLASILGWGGVALVGFKIALIGVKSASALCTLFTYPLTKAIVALRFSTIGASVALLRQRAAAIANTIATKAHTIATFGATMATKAWGVATTLFAKLFRVSMWSVRGALISTGIGALIVGLGLAIEYVCSSWESIAPRLVAVWEWIKGAISPIMDWFSEIFAWVSNGIDTILSGARAVTDFLGITDSKDSKNTATSPSLSTNGLVDSTLATQAQNAQNFYNSTQSRQINDNKTIYINTTASAQEVAQVIASNSYSYAD